MPSRDEIDEVVRQIEQVSLLGEEDVIQYLGSVIEEVKDWDTPQPLTDALGDILVGYVTLLFNAPD
jgi:hypothetical protein